MCVCVCVFLFVFFRPVVSVVGLNLGQSNTKEVDPSSRIFCRQSKPRKTDKLKPNTETTGHRRSQPNLTRCLPPLFLYGAHIVYTHVTRRLDTGRQRSDLALFSTSCCQRLCCYAAYGAYDEAPSAVTNTEIGCSHHQQRECHQE